MDDWGYPMTIMTKPPKNCMVVRVLKAVETGVQCCSSMSGKKDGMVQKHAETRFFFVPFTGAIHMGEMKFQPQHGMGFNHLCHELDHPTDLRPWNDLEAPEAKLPRVSSGKSSEPTRI